MKVEVGKIETGPLLRFLYVGPFVAVLFAMYALVQTWRKRWYLWPLSLALGVVFFPLNTIFNWTAGSYIYKELPLMGDWKVKIFFTKRTQYYIDHYEEGHWKKELADFTAVLLNRYDEDHIDEAP